MQEIWYIFFATLPFTVTLMWTVIFLLSYRRSGRARRFLVFFSLVCCMLYFAHAVHFLWGRPDIGWMDCLYTCCHLSVYPLYYLYIRILTDASRVRLREYWVLLPAVFVSLAEAAALLLHRNPSPVLLVSDLVFPVEILLVLFVGYGRLRHFNRTVENFYSDTEGKTVRPIIVLLIIFAASSLVSVIFNFIGRDSFLDSPLLAVPSLLLTVMIFAVFHVGYRQWFNADSLEQDLGEEPEIPEDNAQQEELFARIRKEMEEHGLFRRHGLKISDVCKVLASNRTYVSTCINQSKGQSFCDFVNTYRVEYVKRILESGTDVNISDLGESAGFSGKSSFFRNFKKSTGMTPSEWQRLHKKVL